MGTSSRFLFKIGRTLFAIPFIIFFVLKIMNWQSSADSFDHFITMWKGEVSTGFFASFLNLVGQFAYPILIVASFIELAGGLLLLFGLKTRLAGWLLVIFLLPVTIFMHPFWFGDATTTFPMLSDFLKNVILLGGALVFATGAGCGCHHCPQDCHHMDDRI